MKKFLSIIAGCLILAVSASAQSISTLPLVTGDTVVNAAAVTKTMPILTGGYAGFVTQPVITKISGTVGGTAILYSSLDGTNYVTTGDTLTLANQTTNTTLIRKAAPIATYYKWIVTGTGTMSAQVSIKYGWKLYQTTK